jgi:hypothetical protein
VDEQGGGILDPSGTCGSSDGEDFFLAHRHIMIARNGENRSDSAKVLYQVLKRRQLGGLIDKIPTEENHVGIRASDSIENLLGKAGGPAAAKMDVADISDAAGIGMGGDDFLTHGEGLVLAELQALTEGFQTATDAEAFRRAT